MSSEEKELVKRAMAGDREAWRELFDRYTEHLLKYLHVLTKNNFLEPKDLLQDTWILAFTKLHLFDARRYNRFYPWLRRLAYNVFVDALRKAGKQIEPIDFFSESVIAPDTDVEGAIESNELREIIYDALGSLSDTQKAVLMLYEIDGLTTAEIAELLGLSKGNVRTILHRARKRLREILEANESIKAYLD